jgi:hypothetical protein
MDSPPLLIERRVQQAFSVTTTKVHDVGLGRDLASALDEAGLRYTLFEGPSYAAAGPVDWSRVVREVVTVLGAAGGLGGIAAVLRAFFGRHKGTKVKFGENGEVLEAGGLSVDDIIRLLDKCRPPMSPDLVVRASRDTDGHEESSPDQIFPGGLVPLEHAESVARHRSRKGVAQEVVAVRADGQDRVIRRYEDGQQMPRRPGCPPWCDRDHEGACDYSQWRQPPLPVKHDRMIGTITQPDGATVGVEIVREQGSQDVVMVGVLVSWTQRLNVHLALPAEDAVTFADLADVLGHADLAEHIRNAAAAITTTGPAAGKATTTGPAADKARELRYTWAVTDPGTRHPRHTYQRATPEQALECAEQASREAGDGVMLSAVHIRKPGEEGWSSLDSQQ